MPRDLAGEALTSEHPAHEPLALSLEDLDEAHAEGVAAGFADAAQVRELEAHGPVGQDLARVRIPVVEPQQEAAGPRVLHAGADRRTRRSDDVHRLAYPRAFHGSTRAAMSLASAGARPCSPRD